MSMSPTLPLPVHKALTRLRRERCLSQQQLAYLSGLSLNTIWNMERGLTTYPTARTLRKLATGLGIPEKVLLRRLGMSPSRVEDTNHRKQAFRSTQPRLDRPAERVATLMEALLAQWQSLTPAQQAYAEATCRHLFQTLCATERSESRHEHLL